MGECGDQSYRGREKGVAVEVEMQPSEVLGGISEELIGRERREIHKHL